MNEVEEKQEPIYYGIEIFSFQCMYKETAGFRKNQTRKRAKLNTTHIHRQNEKNINFSISSAALFAFIMSFDRYGEL